MMRLLERDVAPLFNGALAAVTALAAAFATYAMPNDLFSGLVEATGLPALVPAAEPPLGLTARLAAVAAVAVIAFLAVWFLLGAIDAAGATDDDDYEDEAEEIEEQAEPDAGWELQRRLRRADAHPDAPPRQPLLAKRELGEPADEAISVPEPDWMTPEPLAESLQAEDAVVEDSWAETSSPNETPPPPEELEVPVSDSHDPRDPRNWFAPAGDPTPETTELLPETIPAPEAVSPIGEDDDAEDAVAVVESAPTSGLSEVAVVDDMSTDALMARLPLPEDAGESISSLFQRLDTGLANVEWPVRNVAEPQAPSEPQAPAEQDVAHQLRDALGDLQRMAARRT